MTKNTSKSMHRRTGALAGAAILAASCACLAAGRPASNAAHAATPAGAPIALAPPAPAVAPPVLTAMQEELDRSFATLSKADPPVYFISYTVADHADSSRLRIEWRAALQHGRSRALARSPDAHGKLPVGRYAQSRRPPAERDESRHHRFARRRYPRPTPRNVARDR